MRAQYHRQIEELLSNYGQIDVLWFDGGERDWLNFGGDWKGAAWEKRPREAHYQGRFDWQHDRVYARLRQLQPSILINGRADMAEDFHSREGDRAMGEFDNTHAWELCATVAEGPWGYKPDAELKSLAHLLHLLVGAAGRDGNFLLNIGPRPDGAIEPAVAQRLRDMGEWLRKNGESIYGTRGGPYLPGEYGVSTHRGNVVYLHVLQWPAEKLSLPAIVSAKVVGVTRLDGGAVTFAQNEQGIELSVPSGSCDAIDTIIKLELDRSAEDITPHRALTK